VREAAAAAGSSKAPPRGLQPRHQALRGRHILYAEDSAPSQMIVKRMLDRAAGPTGCWFCHVIDTHVEPSFLSLMAAHDMASNNAWQMLGPPGRRHAFLIHIS